MVQQVDELSSARAGLEVEVVERKDAPGEWVVEAIETTGDGDIFIAIFTGPEAEKRASEYAAFKYGS